jgi:hypothetical protein
MKTAMIAAAALSALALAPAALAQDETAVTVVTPDPGEVSVVTGNPGDIAPVPKTGGALVKLDSAAETAAVIPAPPQTATVVYVYPTTPQTFVPVAMLPSFLVQPGAPLPAIPNYVVQSVPIPVMPTNPTVAASADIDCSDLTGPVFVGAADPHHLDRNGNGIGCEPADR